MGESLAERLGFAATDRVAVVHCDDIGMCHAANVGAFEALANGPATCGSVMVPCPGFEEAAAMARERPDADLGVHLTLNAEWPSLRWGPVAGADAVPSLVDHRGFLLRSSEETLRRSRPEQVRLELRAQVERALAAGIDVTHLDAHMGTCLLPPFVEAYAELACELRVPAFAVRPDPRAFERLGRPEGWEKIERAVERMAAAGLPILDGFDADSLHFEPGHGAAHNARRLAGLGPGVSYLICHPAQGGDELEAITTDAPLRDFERRFYGGEAGRRALASQGIRTAGMRALRALLR